MQNNASPGGRPSGPEQRPDKTCQSRKCQSVAKLLQAGAHVKSTDKGKTALQKAVSSGRIRIVQLLLDAGVSPDNQSSDGRTPLIEAVSREPEFITELLLKAGASPDLKDRKKRTPLKEAIFGWRGERSDHQTLAPERS